MANHTEIIGDLTIPMGKYETTERGEKKTKKRHRNIGTVLRTTWDDGGEALSVRLHAEVLSQPVLAMVTRNGLLPVGEASILCSIYSRDRKQAAPTPAAEAEAGEVPGEEGPF